MNEELIYEDGDFDVFTDDAGCVVLYPKESEDGIAWISREDAIASLTLLLEGLRGLE